MYTSMSTPRDQMAVLLVRLYELLTGETCTGDHPFLDVNAASFADAAVGCLYGLGLTTGTSATTYSPADPVSRLELALFLSRLYRLITTPA